MKTSRRRVSTPARSLSTQCSYQANHDEGWQPSLRTTGRRLCDFHAAVTAFGLAFLLAGCHTAATKTVVKEVSVPVAVQPIKPAQVPVPPAPLGPRPSSLSAAADVLLSKVCELEGYVLRADPLLRLSAGMEQKPLPKFPECE